MDGFYGPSCFLTVGKINDARNSAELYERSLRKLKTTLGTEDESADTLSAIEAAISRAQRIQQGTPETLESFFDVDSMCQATLRSLTGQHTRLVQFSISLVPTPAEVAIAISDYSVAGNLDLTDEATGRTSSEQLRFNVSAWWQDHLAQMMQMEDELAEANGTKQIYEQVMAEQSKVMRQEAQQLIKQQVEVGSTAKQLQSSSSKIIWGCLILAIGEKSSFFKTVAAPAYFSTYSFGQALWQLKYGAPDELRPLL
eukprot:Blabericola_migrator_1__1543@NODE_1407_length_4613_cov_55_511659_g204_i1_p3_GENE_NODE_1407_length_4613_cov_55_511659_g204_i1NODE_1407_length_4613_cov_55_511659_g204_i1_p3_ORF_typecomplete_len255_score41_94Phasin_2/PF09361_10/4_2e03Phasin_2/PF09361_10/0_016UPA_2/PF17809_1/0_32FAM76/PF16046_5/0_23AAA_23/PF13476_6/0_33HSCB_C/PF07743_13/4_5e02HSCB_C/PF07743_13/1_NODE_1407_length_4613_cov_55_511659_g204_i130893853